MQVKTTSYRLNLTRVWIVVGGFAVAGLFQNCSDAKFSSGASGSAGTYSDDYYRDHLDVPNPNPGSCYTVLHQTSTPVRLLFVVDNSGSNVGQDGSDPNKAVRGGSIQAFFDDYSKKQNFFWGFISFKDLAAAALVNSGSAANPVFTNAIATMQSAINTFNATLDSGYTPYQAALDLTKAAIQNDSAADSATKWIVVFLSDGLPNPVVDQSTLVATVQSIVGMKSGRITFNTIYYGATDPAASGRLSAMASAGGGKFLDTNANPTGKSFFIGNIVNVPGTVCN